ncbi:MAG: hypothetical protein JWP57_1757 [Spirosoma sp.]|nr:hypothetical protein [Spirosoma sp.]
MKTALFVTECSIDSAFTLRNWLANTAHESIRLTIVLPYEILPGEPLHKSACNPAKAEAQARLDHWSAILGDNQITVITTETLFGSAKQALHLHLLIRSYDYWLVDERAMPDKVDLGSLLNHPGKLTRLVLMSEKFAFVRV